MEPTSQIDLLETIWLFKVILRCPTFSLTLFPPSLSLFTHSLTLSANLLLYFCSSKSPSHNCVWNLSLKCPCLRKYKMCIIFKIIIEKCNKVKKTFYLLLLCYALLCLICLMQEFCYYVINTVENFLEKCSASGRTFTTFSS